MASLSSPLPARLQALRPVLLVLGGAALITLGAKTQVPFWPVPMTLHTLAVFGVAAALGPRLGLAAMLAYLGAGAAGVPVFSGTPERGIGPAYRAGPTGGYLLGYLLATPIVGRFRNAFGLLGGLAVVYAAGLAWLAAFVPAPQVVTAGFTPFIAADLLKIALICAVIAGARRLRGRAE